MVPTLKHKSYIARNSRPSVAAVHSALAYSSPSAPSHGLEPFLSPSDRCFLRCALALVALIGVSDAKHEHWSVVASLHFACSKCASGVNSDV